MTAASTEGVHVCIVTMGDERPAVIERDTQEPLQYLAPTSQPRKLIERWDAALEAAIERARKR